MLALFWTGCQAAHAAPLLAADCRADQADRETYTAHGDGRGNGTGWDEIARRDAQRQQHVRQALKQQRIRQLEDYRCAALILLHAGDEPTLRLSYALAVQGQALFPGQPALVRLAARAWDRLMMARQQPQWFATQFEAVGAAGFRLYPLATGLMSEAERSRLGGLTDAEAQAELAALNAEHARTARATEPPAPVGTRYRLAAASEQLLSTLDLDVGLANFLAQFRQEGLLLTPSDSGERQGRLIFIPRPAAALRAYFQGEVPRIPRAEGSATPTSASVADVKLELRDGRIERLLVGIDDEVQAAATLVVRPSRVFELRVEPGTDEASLTLTRIRREP